MPYAPIPSPVYFAITQNKTTKSVTVYSHAELVGLKDLVKGSLDSDIVGVFVGKQLKVSSKVETVIEEMP
jgi:hypothetical protein